MDGRSQQFQDFSGQTSRVQSVFEKFELSPQADTLAFTLLKYLAEFKSTLQKYKETRGPWTATLDLIKKEERGQK